MIIDSEPRIQGDRQEISISFEFADSQTASQYQFLSKLFKPPVSIAFSERLISEPGPEIIS